MKTELPDFKSRSVSFGDVVFTKRLSEEWELLLNFEQNRALARYGKSLTASVGLRATAGPGAGYHWADSLFRLDGWVSDTNSSPTFTYLTRDDLEQELVALAALIRRVIPILEDSFCRYLVPLPLTLPEGIASRSGLTAREALPLAREQAVAWAEDALIVGLGATAPFGGGGVLLPMQGLLEGLGPSPTLDGRLAPHGEWGFAAWSPSRDERLQISVPSLGPIRTQRIPKDDNPCRNTRVGRDSLGDNWIDSPEAMRAALAAFSLPPDLEHLRMICSLGWTPRIEDAGSLWEVRMIFQSQSCWRDVTVTLKATSGQVLRVRDWDRGP